MPSQVKGLISHKENSKTKFAGIAAAGEDAPFCKKECNGQRSTEPLTKKATKWFLILMVFVFRLASHASSTMERLQTLSCLDSVCVCTCFH
jgi:hypothetical protein